MDDTAALRADDVVTAMATKARRFAICCGILLQRGPIGLATCAAPIHAPFTLFPSPFPRREFDYAKAIQTDVSEMVQRVSRDHDFLQKSLEKTAVADKFVERLLKILDAVNRCVMKKPAVLLILRSDYMLDGKVNEQSLTCLRQIEVNTVSSALAGQATRMPELHRYTCALRDDLTSDGQKDQIPDNPVVDEIATGIAAAWQAYGSSSTVVVMLVGCDESNVFDQLLVEDALLMNHGINMVRCIFDDIVKGGSMQVSVNRDGTAFMNTITSEVEMNTVAGHLLRTKNAQTEGGGVVHGTAAFDSPLLV